MGTKKFTVESETVQIDNELFNEWPEAVEFELPNGESKTYLEMNEP